MPSVTPLSDARINIRRGDQVIVAIRPAVAGAHFDPAARPVSTLPSSLGKARASISPRPSAKVSSSMATVQRLKEEAQLAEQRQASVPAPARVTAPASTSAPVAAHSNSLVASAPASRKHYRPLDDEFVVLNIVPDDNSCLFTSAAVVLGGSAEPSEAHRLRKSTCHSFVPTGATSWG